MPRYEVEGVPPGESSEQMLARYTQPFLGKALARASHPVMIGTAASDALDLWGIAGAERWAQGGIVRYRSRRDLVELALAALDSDIHRYKIAAMEKTIAFPLDPWFQLGDPRLMLLLVLAVVGLAGQLRTRGLGHPSMAWFVSDRIASMRPVKRVSAWIPTLAGLFLLVLASRTGVLPVVLAALPASLMLAGGVISLLAPDLRAPQHIATGAVLGLLLALPLSLVGGMELGLVTLASSGAAFVAAGWLMIRLEPPLDEVPAPAPSLGYGARVALDGAFLNIMTLSAAPPSANALSEAVRESEAAHALFVDRGWIKEPRSFHRTPPEIETDRVESTPRSRSRLRTSSLRERVRPGPRASGARALARLREEPDEPRLGPAPPEARPVARVRARLRDGQSRPGLSRPSARSNSTSARGSTWHSSRCPFTARARGAGSAARGSWGSRRSISCTPSRRPCGIFGG